MGAPSSTGLPGCSRCGSDLRRLMTRVHESTQNVMVKTHRSRNDEVSPCCAGGGSLAAAAFGCRL